MRLSEFAVKETNKFIQVKDPSQATWANVPKNPGHSDDVTYYKSNNPEQCPFTPGRTTVWFKKVNGQWEEFGEHGPYTYGHLVK